VNIEWVFGMRGLSTKKATVFGLRERSLKNVISSLI